MSSKYLVVIPIDPMKPGDEYPAGKRLPMHCTVMPWFHLRPGVNPVSFSNALGLLACVEEGFELVSDVPALFGPDNDIPVHILKRNEELEGMHTKLLLFLASVRSAPEDMRWIGAGYRPHVTSNAGRAFPPGSRFTPDKLVLVERDEDGVRRVKLCYHFTNAPF